MCVQREQKLVDHLQSLQDLDSLLEELFSWLTRLENQLLDLESESLPDSVEVVEKLIEEHREFMESTAKRQTEVDTVCKVKQPTAPVGRKPSAKKLSTIRFAITLFNNIIFLICEITTLWGSFLIA